MPESTTESDSGRDSGRGSCWTVLRQGRPHARRRCLIAGTEYRARLIFEREKERMRQGILWLMDDTGKIVERASEPMVRTRW